VAVAITVDPAPVIAAPVLKVVVARTVEMATQEAAIR
jgi:hypothetical protein